MITSYNNNISSHCSSHCSSASHYCTVHVAVPKRNEKLDRETVVVVFITGIIVVTVVVVVTIVVVVTVVFTVVVVVLQYMAQIKEKQAEQERGDWERLSGSQRQRMSSII